MDLKSQVIFITGCGSGIGRHLARVFYQEGARVAISDLREETMDYVADWESERYLRQKLDVRLWSDWERAIQATLDKWGRIDVLINNAGVMITNFIDQVRPEEVEQQIDVNLKGVIYGTMQAVWVMKAQPDGGIVINISSLAGVAPLPGLSVYSASKFGVRGFTLAVAEELKHTPVRVYNLAPDAVRTPLIARERGKEAANIVFSGPLLQVEDVEKAVRRLLRRPGWRELLIPRQRGWLALFACVFPGLATILRPWLERQGRRRRQTFK